MIDTSAFRKTLARILGAFAGIGVLIWTIRAWLRRRRREGALLELDLASERLAVAIHATHKGEMNDAAEVLAGAQERDREAKRLVDEAESEIAKRRPKVITVESVNERMEGRP